jgi:hypothetical protein
MTLRSVVLTLAIMGAAAAAAPAAARQAPSRDPGQRTPGARIAGMVVSAEDGRAPIRRAMVTIDGPSQMSQITDDDGRFVFEEVLAGEYQVTAVRAAYLPAAYGARRPGRLASRLAIAPGAAVGDVRLYMARGAVVEGTVRDIDGAPAANVGVVVAPAGDIPQLASILGAPWTTDDRGVYRAYGLAPGSYVVFAIPTVVRRGEIVQPSAGAMDAAFRALASTAAVAAPALPRFDRTVSYGPVFHPSAPTTAQAGVVTVEAGEERAGIDVTLALVPTRAIDGIVVDPAGQPAAEIQLFISGNGTPSPIMFDAAPILIGRPATLGAGRFRYTNVTAGRYTITAKRRGSPPLWAQAEVDVSAADVTGLALRLQPALSISGRVVFDGDKLAPPDNLASVRLTLAPPGGGGGGMGNLTNYGLGTSMVINPDEDGNFRMDALIPGEYVASAFIPGNAPATGWWLRSATIEGVDAVDVPVRIDAANAGNVVFTFSDRHAELSGTLSTPAGQPATDYYVVVIPADRTLWRPNSRRTKIARPSSAGRYLFEDLPPGDYLMAAVTDFAASDFNDRTILDTLARASVKVSLTDGAAVVQDLRIGGGATRSAAPSPDPPARHGVRARGRQAP